MKEKLLLVYSIAVLVLSIGVGIASPKMAKLHKQEQKAEVVTQTAEPEAVMLSWWSLVYPVEEQESEEIRFWLWECLQQCFA